VYERDDLDVIKIGPDNDINFDSHSRFGICDFDGDGADDLFLATGRTSGSRALADSSGRISARGASALNQVRLGYFDDDQRCDVLTEHGIRGRLQRRHGAVGEHRQIRRAAQRSCLRPLRPRGARSPSGGPMANVRGMTTTCCGSAAESTAGCLPLSFAGEPIVTDTGPLNTTIVWRSAVTNVVRPAARREAIRRMTDRRTARRTVG
jgi:hypothetical protein